MGHRLFASDQFHFSLLKFMWIVLLFWSEVENQRTITYIRILYITYIRILSIRLFLLRHLTVGSDKIF
jgi:hypothetical protein